MSSEDLLKSLMSLLQVYISNYSSSVNLSQVYVYTCLYIYIDIYI